MFGIIASRYSRIIRRVKYVAFGQLLMLIALSVQVQAAPLIYENWESGQIDNSVWTAWGFPTPSLYSVPSAFGTTSLDTDGDSSYLSGIVAQQPITIQPGLRVSYKANMIATGATGIFNHMWVYLTPIAPSAFVQNMPPSAWFVGIRHNAEPGTYLGLRNDFTGAPSDSTFASGDLGQWVDWSFEIDAEGTVHYYRNGSLLVSSTPGYTTSEFGQTYYLLIAGRSVGALSLIDEITIEQIDLRPKYIIFSSTRDGNAEIHKMDEDGSNLVNLTNDPASDWSPAPSPDGSRIVFTSDRDGDNEIYSMAWDGSDLVQMTHNEVHDSFAAYSPDGTQIVFNRSRPDGNWDIYLMNADGSNQRPLIASSNLESRGRWSPDGRHLLFHRFFDPPWQVFVFSFEDSTETQLTFSGDNPYSNWSADGMRIAYASRYDFTLWVANIDSARSALSNVAAVPGVQVNGRMVWDGSDRILYSYDSGLNGLPPSDIRMVRPDGSDATAILADGSYNREPIWLIVNFAEVSLPDTIATYNQAVSLPVAITRVDSAIVSAELFVTFDNALLTFSGVSTTGALANGWTVESNIVSGLGGIDTLKIAAATDNSAITAEGTLLYLDFQTADLRAPASSALDIAHVLLNDGRPGALGIDGSLTLVGTDGTIISLPETIIPRWSLDVSVADVDEDRDINAVNSFAIDVAVNGASTETLLLAETGNSTGLFTATIPTRFSLTPVAGNDTLEVVAGDRITFTYIDSLDAVGSTTLRTDSTSVIGGTTGTVQATVVVQPGDTSRVKVVDADLSGTVAVQIQNLRSGETGSALLSVFSPGSSIFYGRFFTDAGAGVSGDSTLSILDRDTLLVSYSDTLTAQGGTATATDQTHAVVPFGDANDNGSSTAFDAALTLLHVLTPSLSLWDSLSVNVDLQAPYGPITPFDASLILQKRVGLIDRFPVQAPTSTNQPQPETTLQPGPKLMSDTRWLSLRPEADYLSVWAEERADIVSGDLLIKGVDGKSQGQAKVQAGEELGGFLVQSRVTRDGLRVVFAGAEAVAGPGELLRVYGVGPDGAQLVRAAFNDGRITAQRASGPQQAVPVSYALHANMPNPFNPETTIRFELPQLTPVRLEVYDVLGQRVRVLVAEPLAAGAHRVVWDGRNAAGAQVSSGAYFYRLQAGAFVQTRRMMLIK